MFMVARINALMWPTQLGKSHRKVGDARRRICMTGLTIGLILLILPQLQTSAIIKPHHQIAVSPALHKPQFIVSHELTYGHD